LALSSFKEGNTEELKNMRKKGNTTTMINLANYYIKRKNLEEAEKSYMIAVEKGSVLAIYHLGFFYLITKGIESEEMKYYFLMALEKEVCLQDMSHLIYYYHEYSEEEKLFFLLQIILMFHQLQQIILVLTII